GPSAVTATFVGATSAAGPVGVSSSSSLHAAMVTSEATASIRVAQRQRARDIFISGDRCEEEKGPVPDGPTPSSYRAFVMLPRCFRHGPVTGAVAPVPVAVTSNSFRWRAGVPCDTTRA